LILVIIFSHEILLALLSVSATSRLSNPVLRTHRLFIAT
jgi:hypothetical protein